MAGTACPLGLERVEGDCPNAPCIECMRRLGDHMIEEVNLLNRQTNVARILGDRAAMDELHIVMSTLSAAVTSQEKLNKGGAWPKVS